MAYTERLANQTYEEALIEAKAANKANPTFSTWFLLWHLPVDWHHAKILKFLMGK